MNKSQVAELKQNIREQLNELKNVVSKQTYRSYEKEYKHLASKTQVIRTENHKLFKLQDDIRTHKENGIATKAKLNEIKKRERNISQEEKNELIQWKKNPNHIVIGAWMSVYVKVDVEEQKEILALKPDYKFYEFQGYKYKPISRNVDKNKASFYLTKSYPNSVEAYKYLKTIPKAMYEVDDINLPDGMSLAEAIYKHPMNADLKEIYGILKGFNTVFKDFDGENHVSDYLTRMKSLEPIVVVRDKNVRTQMENEKVSHANEKNGSGKKTTFDGFANVVEYEDEPEPIIYYEDQEGFDDNACPIISCKKYLQFSFVDIDNDSEYFTTQYKSEYLKQNYIPYSCGSSLILEIYKERVEKYVNSRRAKMEKFELTYKTLHDIIKPECEFKENGWNGYSFNNLINFGKKFKIGMYLFDIHLNVRSHYEPDKRNSQINPDCLYLVFHDKHFYRLNHELNSLKFKIKDMIKKSFNNELCSKPSNKYYTKERDENLLDFIVIKDAKEILEVVKGKNKETFHFYFDGDCLDLFLEFDKKGIQPNVMMKDGMVSFEKILINTLNENMIWVHTLQEEGVTISANFENNIILSNYMRVKNQVCNNLLSKGHISNYNLENTLYMLDAYKIPPLVGALRDNTKLIGYDVIELDYNKFYTSILHDIKEFPVVNSFDKFVTYNDEPIQNLNMYFVEKLLDNDEYPFNKFSLCFGINIRNVSNINILAVLNVSKIKGSNSNEIIKNVYENEMLTVEMKKNIINHVVGNMNKCQNKKTYTSMTKVQSEAMDFWRTNGGRVVPLDMIEQKYYINHLEKTNELFEGFRLISMLIYDTAHKRLLDLKKNVESYGFTVHYMNTDCLWINNNMELFEKFKSDNIELFTYSHKNNYDAIGKLKHAVKMYDTKKIINRPNLLNMFELLKSDNVNHIELIDEFDTNEIKQKINSMDKLLFQGPAGSGKSNGFKMLDDNVLFITPYNALCKDIRKSGKDAVTLHKLLGLKYDDDDLTKMNATDVSRYDIIVFDEIFLYDTFKLGLIKEYINKHNEIRFYATGDCNQLPAIEKLVISDKREYYKSIIYSIFPNVINLTKNKRCVNKSDRELMDNLIQEILNSQDKKDLLEVLKRYDIKIVGNINDIHTKKNICHMNSSCDFVNNLIMKKYHPDTKYIAGDELICRKTLQIRKQKTYVNYTYKIVEIKKNTMILNDDDEDIEVDKEMIERHFKLPYARTCSSVQGMTIDENITIFDYYNNFVDKYWIYTALTRTTELKNVSIYVGKQSSTEDYVKGKIMKMITFHKESDAKACREWNGDYIDLEYVLQEFKNTSNCRYCGEPIDILGDECFSIDRVNNDIAHIKSNCQIICVTCNKSKK